MAEDASRSGVENGTRHAENAGGGNMNSRADSGGGINITRTIRGEVLDRFKAQSLSAKQPVPIIHRVAPSGSKLAVQGSNFTPSTAIIVDGLYAESEYIDDTEIWVTVPKSVRLGAAIVACTGAVGTVLEEIDEPPPVTLIDIYPFGDQPLRTDCPFALAVQFRQCAGVKAKILDLSVTMPDGHRFDRRFAVSDEESSSGMKVLQGFAVGNGG